jgi:hypothetical protein
MFGDYVVDKPDILGGWPRAVLIQMPPNYRTVSKWSRMFCG